MAKNDLKKESIIDYKPFNNMNGKILKFYATLDNQNQRKFIIHVILLILQKTQLLYSVLFS